MASIQAEASESLDDRLGGDLNAAIARAVVRVYRDYAGRGPRKCQAFFRNNNVVVILHDVMTPLERNLVAGGAHDTVLALRRDLRVEMQPHLVAAVEELTVSNVTARMGGSSIVPDVASETFILDRPVNPRRAAAAGNGRHGDVSGEDWAGTRPQGY
jgi:uncharacterized protein YbcI